MFTIDNKLKNANVGRTIRFTEKMFEELDKAAAKYNISFNLVVLQCCQYALNHMGTEQEEA